MKAIANFLVKLAIALFPAILDELKKPKEVKPIGASDETLDAFKNAIANDAHLSGGVHKDSGSEAPGCSDVDNPGEGKG